MKINKYQPDSYQQITTKSIPMKTFKITIVLSSLAIAFFGLAACESISGRSNNSATVNSDSEDKTADSDSADTKTNSEPKNSAGMTVQEARKKAVALQLGMNREAVIALLGNPDETSAGTYGFPPDTPEQRVIFTYRWKKNEPAATELEKNYYALNRLMLDRDSIKLMIRFKYEKKPDGTLDYYVNSWDWPNF